MSGQDLVGIASGMVDAFNAADWDRAAEHLTSGAVYNELGTQRTINGRDDIIQALQGWKAAMPDVKGTITNSFSDGNTVSLEVSWTGTQTDVVTDGFRLLVLVVAAIATSIDAVAVGMTLPAFEVNVLMAASLIGLVTFLAAISGGFLGRFAGRHMGRCAEILGGIFLILIGVRIVLEHTYWAPVAG